VEGGTKERKPWRGGQACRARAFIACKKTILTLSGGREPFVFMCVAHEHKWFSEPIFSAAVVCYTAMCLHWESGFC
jgi:hypothetical protein